MSYKIGYVDEDPKQIKKFERALRDYGFEIIGYNIIPGMLIDDLIEQIYLSDIDLLMIDYLLKAKGVLTFNGDEVERIYSEVKPNFPHIIFTSNESQAFVNVDNPNIIYEKEMVSEDIERFVEILEKNIRSYRAYKEKRKLIIAELIKKREEDGLSETEKDKLLQVQLELSSLDTRQKKEVPLQMIANEKLDQISKTRKEAQEFLRSLIEKRKNNDR